MADLYNVASMTAQRALRELQHRRITYSAAGKGTFVHPEAFDLLRGGVLNEPIDDPDLRHRVAAYLADPQAITIRYHRARTTTTAPQPCTTYSATPTPTPTSSTK